MGAILMTNIMTDGYASNYAIHQQLDPTTHDYADFKQFNQTLQWLKEFQQFFDCKTHAPDYCLLKSTPNRVVSPLRLTQRRLFLEPDPEYPAEHQRWVTDKFDPIYDKYNPKIEDTSTIFYKIDQKTKSQSDFRSIKWSEKSSYKGLGGLTLLLDIDMPTDEWVETFRSFQKWQT